MTAPPSTTTARMASYLSKLSPIPAFPDYSGPYKVGTVDVEIPVEELDAPSPAPPSAAAIQTVQFRIFYPAESDSKGKRITWLPAPQRMHVSAYTQFLGIGPMVASVLSFLPRHLHYTSIPAHKNATLLSPEGITPNNRWPTMIFSHGLGGSRNVYSQIVGSLASHGVVVICPEHRDGSSVVSLIRDPKAQSRFFIRSTRRVIPYHRIPHTQTSDVWAARNEQLKIRLWELGLVHEALLCLDKNEAMTNLNTSTLASGIDQFAGNLHVHEPGSIIFGGHSFGAATIMQLLKSTYYADLPEVAAMSDPLFTPRANSSIRRQVTPQNITILLDMWCFPLLSAATEPLARLPLPVYADVPSAPGGHALLLIQSEAFYKWKEHLHVTAKLISPDPTVSTIAPSDYERPESGVRLPEPHFFYVRNSAHLNQSDFGILFPWLTKKIFNAAQPERALRLNLRALLQHLRANDVPVARTWVGDLVDGAHEGKFGPVESSGSSSNTDAPSPNLANAPAQQPASLGNKGLDDGIHDDKAIMDRSEAGLVEAWEWVDIFGMGAEASPGESEVYQKEQGGEAVAHDDDDAERQMESEIEPHLGGDDESVAGSVHTVVISAAA